MIPSPKTGRIVVEPPRTRGPSRTPTLLHNRAVANIRDLSVSGRSQRCSRECGWAGGPGVSALAILHEICERLPSSQSTHYVSTVRGPETRGNGRPHSRDEGGPGRLLRIERLPYVGLRGTTPEKEPLVAISGTVARHGGWPGGGRMAPAPGLRIGSPCRAPERAVREHAPPRTWTAPLGAFPRTWGGDYTGSPSRSKPRTGRVRRDVLAEIKAWTCQHAYPGATSSPLQLARRRGPRQAPRPGAGLELLETTSSAQRLLDWCRLVAPAPARLKRARAPRAGRRLRR